MYCSIFYRPISLLNFIYEIYTAIIKDRIEKVKQTDQVYDKIYKEEKKRAKKSKNVDSDLSEFMK